MLALLLLLLVSGSIDVGILAECCKKTGTTAGLNQPRAVTLDQRHGPKAWIILQGWSILGHSPGSMMQSVVSWKMENGYRPYILWYLVVQSWITGRRLEDGPEQQKEDSARAGSHLVTGVPSGGGSPPFPHSVYFGLEEVWLPRVLEVAIR